MMLRQFFLYLFLVIFYQAFSAGNYQSVYSGREMLYEYEPNFGFMTGLRVETAELAGTDSILHFNANVHMVSPDCYTPTGSSWNGRKVIVRENGENLFFNRNMDTIVINTAAALHEQWIALSVNDSMHVIAEVTEHKLMDVFDETDSVKVITFELQDNNGSTIQHLINGRELKLSKHFGLIKTLNFLLFPDLNGSDYEVASSLKDFRLAGISNPEKGIQNITLLDVYDHQPGDELHVYFESTYIDPAVPANEKTIRKTIFRFLEREDEPNKITYSIERKRNESIYDFGSQVDFSYTLDTLEKMIQSIGWFDQMPGLLAVTPGIHYVYQYYMRSEPFLAKVRPSNYEYIAMPDSGSCWLESVFDGCLPDFRYKKGLGGPYYSCQDMVSMDKKLVYYKKEGETWGSPLIVSSVHEIPHQNKITVYPNPASNYLELSMENTHVPHLMEIYDLNGKKLKFAELHNTFNVINIQNLPTGIYFYSILNLNSKDIIQNGKFFRID